MYNPGSTIKFREALECFGRGCLPMSPEQSIKNSCCERNIWRRRTGFCEVRSRVGYCFRKEKRGHWPRSLTAWVEWCWEDVAATAKPETILGWYRKLIVNKFDGSKFRGGVGRPKLDQGTERLVVQMARENPSWGYDRIVGALANLDHGLSDQTVGNIFRRHGISPAPKRKQSISWKNFIRSHWDVLVGMDFFTTEVLTPRGLTTYSVLFFIHLETRQVTLAAFTS